MYTKVIEQFTVYGRLSGNPNDSDFAFALEQGYRSAGWSGALHKALETRLAQRKTGYSSPYEIATLYANLEDKEAALEWLETAYRERDVGLLSMKTDFLLNPLRPDPRLTELVSKVSLPQ